MKILLDENFPLALHRALVADGENVEHIITLGLRGISDHYIRERLLETDVLYEEDATHRPASRLGIRSSVTRSPVVGGR